MPMADLHYDYTEPKEYCKQIGLVWLGDDWVHAADSDAKSLNFTQAQVNCAMRHHLWQVKTLFNPKIYKLRQRLWLAAHFLFGG